MSAAVEREMSEETSLEVVCGPLVGWAERISDSYHFVIFDFAVDLAQHSETPIPVAGDDASEVCWVPLAEVGQLQLAEGLREFLSEHGVIP